MQNSMGVLPLSEHNRGRIYRQGWRGDRGENGRRGGRENFRKNIHKTKVIMNKETEWGITSYFRLHCKTIQIKISWYCHKNRQSN